MSIDPTLPPGKLASQLIREPDPRVVAPFVDHPNIRVRESAVGALIRTDATDAEGYLIAYIAHSSDRYLVPRVNLRLSKGASPKAISALAKLVHHPIEDIKASAIDAIGRLGDSSATPIFLDALTDRDWVAKWSAMRALAEHGDLRAMDAVIARLRQSLSRQRADNVAGPTEVSYALEYLWRWRRDPRADTTLEWVRSSRLSRLHSRERDWLATRERSTDT